MERATAGRNPALRQHDFTIEPFLLLAAPVFFIGLGISFAQDRRAGSWVAFEPEEIVVQSFAPPIEESRDRSPGSLTITLDAEPEVIVGTAPPAGELLVNAPEGAQIFIDGRRIGRAPVKAAKVVAGEHTVRIVHGGIEVSDVAQVPARTTIHYDLSFTISEE